MQIRLTVTLGPRGSGGQGASPSGGTAGGAVGAPHGGAACDVLVTAPAGTPLSAVAGGLVSTVTAALSGSAGATAGQGGAAESSAASGGSAADSTAAVYAGTERLDPHRQKLGEPPLLDGAVISLYGPTPLSYAPALPAYGSAKARLHVIAGPDAGGIHLLQGGAVRLGRSAEADVPLDDPDVSRLHCAVTVSDGGAVTVADLGSTNGTSLDGAPVGTQPVLFRPGSVLRVGESALRVETSALAAGPTHALHVSLPDSLPTEPDGQGQLRLTASRTAGAGGPSDPSGTQDDAGRDTAVRDGHGDGTAHSAHGYVPGGPFPGAVPEPRDEGTTHGSGVAQHARSVREFTPGGTGVPGPSSEPSPPDGPAAPRTERARARGLGAWARRFAGGPADEQHPTTLPGQAGTGPSAVPPGGSAASVPADEGRRPDPAAVLLTALGPGPRLWEREPRHPDSLTVRIGTAHTTHRSHGHPGPPVTVDLRTAGALGLAGPRPRLTGLARSVLAQLAALHGPSTLELVLISADRARPEEERVREWSWLGWLPHVRPAHGQDCRLLTAYDRDQAAARVAELAHRLDESGQGGPGPRAPGQSASTGRGPACGAPGPYTLLVVDGDPGTAALRDAVARLAAEGPRAGIHVLCLAETPAATPSSPVAETVRAAYETSSAFRECGALALLSGAVATAVRVVHREGANSLASPGSSGTPGTVCTLDAVSAAWVERFARALAPLRETEGTPARTGAAARPVVTLPRSARLLDELGLARATPAALLSRWAEQGAPGGGQSSPGSPGGAPVPGRASLVFGAGPRGPLEAELDGARGHALVTGPSGSGKTELLRSLAASLSVGAPPDRLQLVLVDGSGDDGLHICLELPHAKHHMAANDPAVMREFAQSLSTEVKRRAELIGEERTYEDFVRGVARPEHRAQAQHLADPAQAQAPATSPGGGDSGTLRFRTRPGPETGAAPAPRPTTTATATGEGPTPVPPASVQEVDAQRPDQQHLDPRRPDAHDTALPRVVVLVDDLDTLADPALGNPGRPAAGSVMRALESVAKEGPRLGMHLVSASGRPDRTAATAPAQAAALHAELTPYAQDGSPGEAAVPGRGTLFGPFGTPVAFQAGRVTGRIPRTATQRPTVVPLDWSRAGDPPTQRPVRELGNGPTDLALLASAVERAAQSVPRRQHETRSETL